MPRSRLEKQEDGDQDPPNAGNPGDLRQHAARLMPGPPALQKAFDSAHIRWIALSMLMDAD